MITSHVVENVEDAIQNTVLFCQGPTLAQRDPCALVFAIAALDLLMHALLHLSLQDSRSCWFVEAGDLQNVGGIDPVVGAASHDMVSGDLELVDGDLGRLVMSRHGRGGWLHCCRFQRRSPFPTPWREQERVEIECSRW